MQSEPSKADPPKRKRRRFQFRLRTLMIGVTLVAALAACCRYVDRETSIVNERRKVLTEINGDALPSNHVGVLIDSWSLRPGGYIVEERASRGIVPSSVEVSISPKKPWDKPSAFRKWLGDSDMQVLRAICVSADAPESEVDRLHGLFPEAEIYRVDQTATRVQ